MNIRLSPEDFDAFTDALNNVRDPSDALRSLMREAVELWNETLAEPVPQHLLDVLGAADKRGECSSGGPDGSTKPDAGGSK